MRVLVFVLILSNLLFLAWTQGYFGAPANPDALRVQQQLLADRVTVVSSSEPPTKGGKPVKVEPVAQEVENKEPEKKEPEKKEPEKKIPELVGVCLRLSELTETEADRLEKLVAKKMQKSKIERSKIAGRSSYWVHIPPLPSKKDAESKVAELKTLGVDDLFVMPEDGPTPRAISLGVFSSREGAETLMETLRGKGVRSAKLVERSDKPVAVTLEIRGDEAKPGSLRQSVAEALPNKKLVVCKSKATTP